MAQLSEYDIGTGNVDATDADNPELAHALHMPEGEGAKAALAEIVRKQKEAVGTELVALQPGVIRKGESTKSPKVGMLEVGQRVTVLEEKFSTINEPNTFGKPIIRIRIKHGWISKNSHTGTPLLAEVDSYAASQLEPPKEDIYDQQVSQWKNPMQEETYSKVQGSAGQIAERKWDPAKVGDALTPLDALRETRNAEVSQKRTTLTIVLAVTAGLSVTLILLVAHIAGWTCEDHVEEECG